MDDFCVKIVNETDVNHLIQTLKQDYEIEENWEGTRYLGSTLDWDYKKREVHLSMPPASDTLYPNNFNINLTSILFPLTNDATNLLLKEEKKYIQQTVESIMLTALGSIASTQAESTEETMANVKLFLDYAASHQDTILTYQASDRSHHP